KPIDLLIEDGVTYIDNDFIQSILGLSDNAVDNLEAQDLSPEWQELREQLKTYLVFEQWHQNFDGQVLVAVGDEILVHQAYGKANLLTGSNATNEDTYSIGSVTKQITAYAIMKLESEGLLSFEDTIDEYLEDAPYGNKVTIHQLLTHTSGLPEYTEALFAGEPLADYDAIVAYVSSKPLNFDPGTDWLYCNTGYYLLGNIVASVSGESLEDYLEANVFEPLEMDLTGWAYKEDVLQMTTQGSMQGEVEQTLVFDELLLSVAEGAGSVISTADDMYLWQKALYDNTLLDDESLALMVGNPEDMSINPNYGYGLMNIETPYGVEFGHGGNTLGYTASSTYLPAMDTHIVILSNRGYVNLNGIKNNIYTLLTGGEVSLEVTETIELPLEALEKFVGDFEIPEVLKIKMFVLDGKLMLQGEGQPPVELTPTSAVNFENKTYGIAIQYDDEINPTSFTLFQSGLSIEAIKQATE
ncbi:MAG: beta-lactamase family protein, partial [Clostridiales bacterium]|nr:beta-lactamase family protein [Clostridiales bacterium]